MRLRWRRLTDEEFQTRNGQGIVVTNTPKNLAQRSRRYVLEFWMDENGYWDEVPAAVDD